MVELQSTDLSEIQCGLVPDFSVDGDFNLIRTQRIGIILMKNDSTMGKWTMGVEDKGTIGERKLKSGIGSVLWSMGASVGKMRFVGMPRLVGVTGLMGMIWLVGMTRFMRMIRFVRMIWFVRRIGLLRMVRMMRRLWLIGTMRFAVTAMPLPARMFNLFRLRPIRLLVAFEPLVGIESGLHRLSAF